ncbi:rhamnan synthesis F family protein [Nitrosovibrio tenuis]|uniref:Rhamnosyltransferase n=1 Tax=Nitrosovibrio tenuis TaxID=1233 RepID=A0A1H7I815_9PROT|nr:rhamnan synthesis F family protein [Nitrosovibrio tenuis]SEK56705.1 rhamnosyltransferase [Nitrosovibrio tenuis]
MRWYVKAVRGELRYFWNLTSSRLRKKKSYGKPLVRYRHKGLVTPNYDQPVCFFCSYDKQNLVRKNVYYYLDALAVAGFNTIFISSSDGISDIDLKKLSEYCICIINRENKGYDFYGWKTGLEEYPQYKSHAALLLANDSVLGPLFSIDDLVPNMERCDADIIGMTDSLRFYPHLQSYFLYCKKSVIVSDDFINFFNQVDVLELKEAIIRRYEVGFSRLLGLRFSAAALYGLKHVLERVSYEERPKMWIEPTFHLWKTLITEFKFPFIKKSLLARKGVSIKEISEVLATANSDYNVEILNDWLRGG